MTVPEKAPQTSVGRASQRDRRRSWPPVPSALHRALQNPIPLAEFAWELSLLAGPADPDRSTQKGRA